MFTFIAINMNSCLHMQNNTFYGKIINLCTVILPNITTCTISLQTCIHTGNVLWVCQFGNLSTQCSPTRWLTVLLCHLLAVSRCKFGHHPNPIGYRYLCAKFHFCCTIHCWTSPWRKIHVMQSFTQSLNTNSPSLFDVPGNNAFASEKHKQLS